MAMNYLKELAASPLPITTHRREEIEQIRQLKHAGSIIASISDDATLPAARVIAITREAWSRLDDGTATVARRRSRQGDFHAQGH